MNWDDVPSMPDYNPGHNYCRNLGKYSKRPYCFIPGDTDPRMVPCSVPKCGKLSENIEEEMKQCNFVNHSKQANYHTNN